MKLTLKQQAIIEVLKVIGGAVVVSCMFIFLPPQLILICGGGVALGLAVNMLYKVKLDNLREKQQELIRQTTK